jgi:hypothetical protein
MLNVSSILFQVLKIYLKIKVIELNKTILLDFDYFN